MAKFDRLEPAHVRRDWAAVTGMVRGVAELGKRLQ
jgi:hypothetical protein